MYDDIPSISTYFGFQLETSAHNIGYRQWRITANEMISTLKKISGARQTSG